MPVSKNALIRYKTIDRCLRNRQRKWTLDDLIEACSDALYEYEGRDEGVSRRTVQLDIQMMRSDKLGYNAPIKVVENKYYIYDDPKYSITESPLSPQDIKKMGEAVEVLRQLSGFQEFSGMEDIMGRLEDRVNMATEKSHPVIFFDKNDKLKGLEFIEPLHSAILAKRPLKINYQSFRARFPTALIFHPYALKEFNNRWFVYGNKPKDTYVVNLALDRIVSLEEAPGVEFIENSEFNPETWFDDLVGVTKFPTDKCEKVRFWASPLEAPYIKTKPIHNSQKVIELNRDGSAIFEIDVIVNRELVRLIFGYAEGLKVLSPRKLQNMIKKHFRLGLENYTTQE
ncbi:MAG: WYL domain-containing protein [Bacteroidales bacterium]|nr:WYL domain-containing protein [Bacteroidales bacterium]